MDKVLCIVNGVSFKDTAFTLHCPLQGAFVS